MEEYIVQYGDTLSIIAAKTLGDKNRWREIAQLNNLQNANELFVGQRLKLPNGTINIPSNTVPDHDLNILTDNSNQIPASLALARGFMFVVFEQLPDVGSNNVIRKVAVIPKDYSLLPLNPLANVSAAEHALGNNNSPFLSTSNRPYGAPKYQGKPLLIDLDAVKANGTQIYTEAELILELRAYSAKTGINVDTLIQTIQNAEGEVLIRGGVPGDAVKRVSNAHTPYIETAEEIWKKFEATKNRPQMEAELEALAKAYNKAKIVGRVGRVLTVVGVVFTTVDVANAAQKSYDKRSYKPLAAETVRQVGGWSGAYAGAIAGAGVGAAFGIETGPGLIITGAIGAIIFGAIGYWRGDVIAGWIDPPEETTTELRKDVRTTDNFAQKGITLTVAMEETQYMFCRRALMQAAFEAGLLIEPRRREFADKFFPLNANTEKIEKFQVNWEGKDPSPNDGRNVKPAEFDRYRGKQLTYYLNQQEVNELIKLVIRGY